MTLSRRHLLGTTAAAATLSTLPAASRAATPPKRSVTVNENRAISRRLQQEFSRDGYEYIRYYKFDHLDGDVLVYRVKHHHHHHILWVLSMFTARVITAVQHVFPGVRAIAVISHDRFESEDGPSRIIYS